MADNSVDKAVLEEALGVTLPENCEISIRDLDSPPASEDELSEQDLDAVAGGAMRTKLPARFMKLTLNRGAGGMSVLAAIGSAQGMRRR